MKHPMQCAKCFRVCRLSNSGKTWVCTICKHREKAEVGQAVKGTPMVDAMMKFCFGTDEEFVRIKDAAKLERELNAANTKIKWLEEAGDEMADLLEGRAVTWNKAKEAKP